MLVITIPACIAVWHRPLVTGSSDGALELSTVTVTRLSMRRLCFSAICVTVSPAAFYVNRRNLYVAAKGFNIIVVDHLVTVFMIACTGTRAQTCRL